MQGISFDEAHIWHPYTQAKLAGAPYLVTHAEKEFLYIQDSQGVSRKVIDGISSWWVNIHGHSHPQIIEAIQEQAKLHQQVIFANFTHQPAIDLVEGLLELMPRADLTSSSSNPENLNRAFFSDNGSTAVEVAIKMAVQYHYNNGELKRNRIVALEHSYHGDTVGAMSVGSADVFHQAFKTLVFPVDFIPSPAPDYSRLKDSVHKSQIKTELKEEAETQSLDAFCDLINRYPDEIAAVIVEPLVQGAGGMRFHRNQFLQKLRAITRERNIFLIADEVFMGFGRSGFDFATTAASIVPDILCLSKALTGGALPMGLTFCTEKIYQAFYSENKLKTFFHGHSYTANSLACASALASLKLYRQENRLQDVEYINLIYHSNAAELAELRIVRDLRILGAILVVELNANDGYLSDYASRVFQAALARGLLLRPLGNVIYLIPPYIISVDALNYSLKVLKEILLDLSYNKSNASIKK